MKKTLLAVATSAAIAAPHATAQQTINSSGTGQLLLYPFYSTQKGSNTYMHVVNNTSEQKAVKVRFMEAQGSSVVLEFNVYLGGYDIFPVALASNEFGGTSVLATDSTCTVPELGTDNPPYDGTQRVLNNGKVLKSQPFVPYQYDSEESADISRTLIGHAEVIEMGVVSDSIDVSDCDGVFDQWTSGDWASNPSADVTAPTGGLSGSSLFINPDLAFSMNLDVTAIDGFLPLAYHSRPGSLNPTLLSGNPTAELASGLVLDYSSSNYGSALATSALLAASSVHNEVNTEDAIAAETSWVLTFPTKKHLDGNAPFTTPYDGTEADGGACEDFNLVRRDRESNSSSGAGSFVPADGGVDDKVCNSVEVLAFNSKSALVTDTFKGVSYSFQSGGATITAGQQFPADDNGVVIDGLPVIGFAATRIVNGDRSYGFAQNHKTNVVSSSS